MFSFARSSTGFSRRSILVIRFPSESKTKCMQDFEEGLWEAVYDNVDELDIPEVEMQQLPALDCDMNGLVQAWDQMSLDGSDV